MNTQEFMIDILHWRQSRKLYRTRHQFNLKSNVVRKSLRRPVLECWKVWIKLENLYGMWLARTIETKSVLSAFSGSTLKQSSVAIGSQRSLAWKQYKTQARQGGSGGQGQRTEEPNADSQYCHDQTRKRQAKPRHRKSLSTIGLTFFIGHQNKKTQNLEHDLRIQCNIPQKYFQR